MGGQYDPEYPAGNTDAETILAGLNLRRLKACREDPIKSLTGFYKPHFITVLNYHLSAYRFYKSQMLSY